MLAVDFSLASESCSERPTAACITPRPDSSITKTLGLKGRRNWTSDMRRKVQAKKRAEAFNDSFCTIVRGFVLSGFGVRVRNSGCLSIRETKRLETGCEDTHFAFCGFLSDKLLNALAIILVHGRT